MGVDDRGCGLIYTEYCWFSQLAGLWMGIDVAKCSWTRNSGLWVSYKNIKEKVWRIFHRRLILRTMLDCLKILSFIVVVTVHCDKGLSASGELLLGDATWAGLERGVTAVEAEWRGVPVVLIGWDGVVFDGWGSGEGEAEWERSANWT